MKSEIQTRLEQLAYSRTNAFCYSCYKAVTQSHCPTCGSDDLMREMFGVGVEFGTDWVIREILSPELNGADAEELFEQSVRECYSEEVTVGWMKLDTVSVMKEIDFVSWNMAAQEWIDSEVDAGIIVSFDEGGTYYWISEIEELLTREGI